jgi:hypothetical protein
MRRFCAVQYNFTPYFDFHYITTELVLIVDISRSAKQRQNMYVSGKGCGTSAGKRGKTHRTRRQIAGPVAMVYERQLECLLQDVVCAQNAKDSRLSHDYTARQRGALLELAAVSGVTEPQAGGRLHRHIGVYSSTLDPTLLKRLAAVPPAIQQTLAQNLDSMSCTHVHPEVRKWFDEYGAGQGPASGAEQTSSS